MDQIINQLQNTQITSTLSSLEVENGFLDNFNKIFAFESNVIKIVGTIEYPWFRAKDILKILGYSENKSTLQKFIQKYIPEKYKKDLKYLIDKYKYKLDVTYNESEEIYINKDGLSHLLIRSTKPNKENAIKWFKDTFKLDIINVVNTTHEQNTIGPIQKALSQTYKTEYQYNTGPYRIDLYLPEIRLAIECDEFNHVGRDQLKEKERENYIKDSLSCEFYRFNPNRKNFDIFVEIGLIFNFISGLEFKNLFKN